MHELSRLLGSASRLLATRAAPVAFQPHRIHLLTFPVFVLFGLALACGGSGPSGPPGDRTAPPAPNLALIEAGVPTFGQSVVRGEIAAVEARSTVVLENVTGGSREGVPVIVESRASVDGAFTIQVRAVLGDELAILARDDAGNRSPAVRMPAGPDPGSFQLSAVSGAEQVGVVNRPLPEPFRVRVRGGSPSRDLPGVDVGFEVVAGSGTLAGTPVRSDSAGVAEALLTLGPSPGPVEVRARLTGGTQEVRFRATAGGAPEVLSLSPTEGERGSLVTIAGRNFSPIAAHDRVEFNGVEADIQSAALDRLSVAVPAFGSDGPVTVTLAGVRSNGVPFKVKGPPPVMPAVGSVQSIPLTAGSSGAEAELRLGFMTGGEEYVLAVQALSTTRSTSFRHSLAGDAAPLPEAAEGSVPGVEGSGARGQLRLDGILRGWEAELARQAKGKLRPSRARLQVEPQLGDRREFHAINTLNPAASITDPANFDRVSAVLRYKGAHTLVFVDDRVPGPDLTDAEVRQLGDRFDTRTYGVDRDAFGDESDIDGDERVTILLTATVNELNRGASPADGLIIGFFFGLDLLPQISPSTSNAQELFYGFVPDPSGRFGSVVPRDFALAVLNEVFAHEFQHMISFNEHVLVRGGQSEDVWLNEGLSQVAEDLNGFPDGNEVRSALYLEDPAATGLALDGGGGGLSERGASFLFLRHLADQRGEGVFRPLVQTRATGIANVQIVTQQSFANLFGDWFASLFLDDAGLGSDPRFQIPSLNVRATYDQVRAQRPTLELGPFLNVLSLDLPGASLSSTTVGTAGTFYKVVNSGGPSERRLRILAPSSSQTQVAVIRTR